jgi:cytochrome c oxidase cbb3-type subunit 3
MSDRQIDEVSGVGTTGHEWDGIKELDNPMPRWWLWTFYATIAWALAYTVAYPAWPLISSATTGLLGYSSRADVKDELAAAEAAKGDYVAAVADKSVEEILADDELRQFATAAGAAAFKVNCVQCHGSGATGGAGYPNLNDDDWLWGGTPEAIV